MAEVDAKRLGLTEAWCGWILVGVALLGIGLRLFLLDQKLMLYTLDSGDYLNGGYSIVRSLDFMGDGLYDWRMPGYSLFLAMIRLVSSDLMAIVWAQSAVAIGAILVGVRIGRLGRSWLSSVGLAAFLALCPVLLLIERFIMSEALFVFTLLLYTASILHIYANGAGRHSGIILGLLLVVNALIRVNSLFFTLPLAVALLGAVRRAATPKRFVVTSLGIVIVLSTVLGGWAWRNHTAYGIAALSLNVERNRLIYMGMHDLLDPTLPLWEAIDAPIDNSSGVDSYAVLDTMRELPTVEAERRSREIVEAHIVHNPAGYARAVFLSVASFSGLPLPGVENERVALRGWFSIAEQGQPAETLLGWLVEGSWRLSTAPESQGGWVQWWRRLGVAYLLIGRPLLLGGALAGWLFGLRRALGRPLTTRRFALVTLGMAYAVTLLAHAIFLADYDRFSFPFDWVYVALITFAVTEWRASLGGRRVLSIPSR